MVTTAIIFDMDDTLIEDEEATHRAFVKTSTYACEQIGREVEELSAKAYRWAGKLWSEATTCAYCNFLGISASEGLWGEFVDKHGNDRQMQLLAQWVGDYRVETWRRALTEYNVQDDALARTLADLFRTERRSNYHVFSEVTAALRNLQGTYKLAMLTNGASSVQREKLEQSGLSHYFDTIVVSGEVNVGKPDPEVFVTVLKQLAVPPEETVMVGNSLQRDIFGAYQSDMRGVWMNRAGLPCAAMYKPMIYAEITTVDELESIPV